MKWINRILMVICFVIGVVGVAWTYHEMQPQASGGSSQNDPYRSH